MRLKETFESSYGKVLVSFLQVFTNRYFRIINGFREKEYLFSSGTLWLNLMFIS